MTRAAYGRMKYGRCIHKTFDESGNTEKMGCSEDILRYFCNLFWKPFPLISAVLHICTNLQVGFIIIVCQAWDHSQGPHHHFVFRSQQGILQLGNLCCTVFYRSGGTHDGSQLWEDEVWQVYTQNL